MTTESKKQIDQRRESLRRWIPATTRRSSTRGVNHVAIFAKDLEETAAFYSEVMGMPLVDVTANRDSEDSTHMNVDVGGGIRLSFFDFPHVPRLHRRAPQGVGGVMHVAIGITPQRMAGIKQRLTSRRQKFQEVGGSLYVDDPNGLNIELLPIG